MKLEAAVRDPAPPPAARSLDAGIWLRIGLLSFGGPAGQIALMQRMLVDERRWIDPERFLAALNFCMLLPGPEAQQLAAFIGWHRAGPRGALVAGTLFVLPGALVMLALSAAYVAWGRLPLVEAAFLGIKCAVVAIVVEALIRIARRALVFRGAVAVAIAAFLATFVVSVPFPLVVLSALAVGFVAARGEPAPKPPASAPRDRSHLARGAAAALAWLVPTALLVHMLGSAHVLSRVATFYGELAFTTFGGAYAVLAYVAERAVADYGWLDAATMADGLGLAETTPGPLILVLQFVAYVAGHREGGPLAAVAASAVALWVLFVPSFMWIFLGAPYVDRLNANPRLRGALRCVTAAVVGVVASLSVWFVFHVAFARVGRLEGQGISMPWPELSSFEPRTILPLALACVILLGLKRGIAPTLAVAALAGLAVARG